jgi:PRTRC genetic system ThiF family protein
MGRVHLVHSYIQNPQHPVTIAVIGAGGTGSQVVQQLGRIHATLKAINHPGLKVSLIDDDIVTEANLGRQLFSKCDVGRNKAHVIIERINRFYGTNWDCYDKRIDYNSPFKTNITISCVDNMTTRRAIEKLCNFHTKGKHYRDDQAEPLYWIDFGNGPDYGQVLIQELRSEKKSFNDGNNEHVQLKSIKKMFPKFLLQKDKPSEPSCSVAEAISRQDLFTNTLLSQVGCSLLWNMFKNGLIDCNGAFVNVSNLSVKKIKL